MSDRGPGGRPRGWTAAEVALVGVAAVWGLTFVMVQDAIEVLAPLAFLAYRFIPAAALVGLAFRRRLGALGRDGVRAGVLMGVFLTAGYVLQTLGLQHTSVSNAGFITGLFVVLTPLLGAAVLRQRPGRRAWWAAGVAALGLALLSGVVSGGINPLGDGLVLGCAVAFAAHILATGRAVGVHDAGALCAVQLAVCGLFCLVVAGIGGDLTVPETGQVWVALAVTTLLASALGFFVQTYAQQHASPARTALILASEPAFAGLFGYLLAGDRLGVTGGIGGALILGAIVAVDLVPRWRAPRPLPEG